MKDHMIPLLIVIICAKCNRETPIDYATKQKIVFVI